MKHIKHYETKNYPNENDYILYQTTDNSHYYILKIISIEDYCIKLKTIYDIYNNINTPDKRGILDWTDVDGGMITLSDRIIYFSNKLKDVLNKVILINDTTKYNL